MRKYIIGFIVGLLVSSAIPVYGEVISKVGKTVQAENSVIVDGVELDVRAVNIDGTTYTPNRALAESLGMDIIFVDQKVVFKNRGGNSMQLNGTADDPTNEVDDISAEIEAIIAQGKEIDERAIKLQFDYSSAESEEQKNQIKAEYDSLVEQADALKNRLSELGKLKDQLEIK